MKMKYVVIAMGIIITVILLLLIARSIVGNQKYYESRDLAITACRTGDMAAASEYIQIALSHVKDPDLINEGLHYKMLFEYGICEE